MQEHTYEAVRAALRLPNDDAVEELVIKAIERGCVRAKLDGAQRVLRSSGGVHRQFTEQHWAQLRQQLHSWQLNLKRVRLLSFNWKSVQFYHICFRPPNRSKKSTKKSRAPTRPPHEQISKYFFPFLFHLKFQLFFSTIYQMISY